MIEITNASACRELLRSQAALCRPIQVAKSDIATCGAATSAAHREAFGTSHAWTVLGPGPVYPVAPRPITFGTSDPSLVPSTGGPWYAQKVGWLLPPREYNGSDVMIRVFPVDHTGRALLHWGDYTGAEYLTGGRGGPPFRPDTTFVTEPGCYAWHIDGNDFHYTVFFTAKIAK